MVKRVWQHKNELADGFTKRYGIKMLVWYEQHSDVAAAILRKKHIKKWNRAWKLELIEAKNSEWRDLYAEIAV